MEDTFAKFWLGATSLRTFAFDVGERNSKIGVIVWDNLQTNVGTRIWHRPADIAGANNIINLLKERESLEIGPVERPR